MGNIRGKALFTLNGILNFIEHFIEGMSHLMDFITALIEQNALGKITLLADASYSVADGFNRTEAVLHDAIADKNRDEQKQQRENQKRLAHGLTVFPDMIHRHDAAYPLSMCAAGGNAHIVVKIAVAVGIQILYILFVKGKALRKFRRIFSV